MRAYPQPHYLQGAAGIRKNYGAPGETRTPNLLIRSQMLYPIELRALWAGWGARSRILGWPARLRGPMVEAASAL
jgi:hypothetical protein